MRLNVYYPDYELLQEIVSDYCLFHENFEIVIVTCSQAKLLHNAEITTNHLEIYVLQLNTETDDAFAERLRILNSMTKMIIVSSSLREIHHLIHRHVEIYDYLLWEEQLDVCLRLQQLFDEFQEMCCQPDNDLCLVLKCGQEERCIPFKDILALMSLPYFQVSRINDTST